MSIEIEEVELDLELLDEINKLNNHVTFPAINIFKDTVYFNAAASKYVPTYFKWRINDDWCVLVASDSGDRNVYKSWKGPYEAILCRFPSEISPSYFMMKGLHKLYKTKNGIAFKRYEKL